MIVFPDPSVETEYTDPNGSVWEFNGTGWVRQCAGSDGGDGGGDGEDGFWPPMPKPSVDLLAFPSGNYNYNSLRAIDFFKVEEDGSLSLYERLEDADPAFKVHFANTRPIVAFAWNNRYAKFYDYSTSPMTLVYELDLGTSAFFSFSASDEYILATVGRKAKGYRESSPGANDWTQYGSETFIVDEDEVNAYLDSNDITDPEERLTSYSLYQPGSFPHWTGSREPLFFAYQDYDGTNAQNICLIEATASGPVLKAQNWVRGLNSSNAVVGNTLNSTSEGHPHLSAFAYGAQEAGVVGMEASLDKWTAGLITCSGFGNTDIANAVKLAPSRHRSGKAYSPVFSPSGNYFCVKQQDSNISIYRVHKNGDVEFCSAISLTSNTAPSAWSADEKFLYVWEMMSQDPVTGDRGKVVAYSFADGNAALIGDTGATVRGVPIDTNHTAARPARTKF